MRWKTIIALAISIVVLTSEALDHDWSLEKMCLFHKGGFEPRQAKSDPDVCKFEFPTSTSSQDEAELFCNTFVPYHNIEVQHGEKTKCKAAATLMCEPDWVQMYGRCYQITRKLRTYKDARKHCSSHTNSKKTPLGASVAFLHREDLIGRWRDYFQNVNRFWLDASEVYTERLLYNEGPNMLIAIDGHRYGVRSNSLLRVPETEKAFSLCEYTPPMNKAESNHLTERYDEIYYPSIKTKEGVSIRSASSRNRDNSDILADSKYCQGVLSPFFRSVDAQSAIPTKGFVDELAKEKSTTLIRTSVISHDSTKNSRVNKMCTVSQSNNYGVNIVSEINNTFFRKTDNVWRAGFPKEQCDGASWSTGVHLSRKDAGLEDMSDARFAPIYCQTRFETQYYGDCPAGYTGYVRKSGQKWCHAFFSERTTYDEANKFCTEKGAFISGFSDFEEMKLMDKLANQSNVKFGNDKNIWLGVKRREACNQYLGKGFDDDPNSPCSKKRVFEWINGVAENPPAFEGHWIRADEPNMGTGGSEPETRLVLIKGWVTIWVNGGQWGDLKLNDVRPTQTHHIICGREADIVVKTLD